MRHSFHNRRCSMHSLLAYGCIFLIFISVVLLVLLFAKSKGSALSQFVQENEKEERRLELRNIKGYGCIYRNPLSKKPKSTSGN